MITVAAVVATLFVAPIVIGARLGADGVAGMLEAAVRVASAAGAAALMLAVLWRAPAVRRVRDAKRDVRRDYPNAFVVLRRAPAGAPPSGRTGRFGSYLLNASEDDG